MGLFGTHPRSEDVVNTFGKLGSVHWLPARRSPLLKNNEQPDNHAEMQESRGSARSENPSLHDLRSPYTDHASVMLNTPHLYAHNQTTHHLQHGPDFNILCIRSCRYTLVRLWVYYGSTFLLCLALNCTLSHGLTCNGVKGAVQEQLECFYIMTIACSTDACTHIIESNVTQRNIYRHWADFSKYVYSTLEILKKYQTLN